MIISKYTFVNVSKIFNLFNYLKVFLNFKALNGLFIFNCLEQISKIKTNNYLLLVMPSNKLLLYPKPKKYKVTQKNICTYLSRIQLISNNIFRLKKNLM